MDKHLAYLIDGVEQNKKAVLDAERQLWNNPEPGYREWKTNKYLADIFTGLGYELTFAGDIPGFYTILDTGREGPMVALFGEMDSLINEFHPECDPETKAVHSCGHNCQCAAMVGLAYALKQPGALDGMSGKIMLCAVPAEELIEMEYRQELIRNGVIKYTTGKPEFLRRGYLDGVDIGFIVHNYVSDRPGLLVGNGYNGSISKRVEIIGRSTHAATTEDKHGVNALYAASQALSACNAVRENFPYGVKWHPILQEAGNAVNAIPDKVIMESMVRGSNINDMQWANDNINRAIACSAASMGATAHVKDELGYAAFGCDQKLQAVCQEGFAEVFPDLANDFVPVYFGGSGDIAFLGDVMSASQIVISGGVTGTVHGSDYCVSDPEKACVVQAKSECAFIWHLLKDNAAKARAVVEAKKPFRKTKEACMAQWDTMSKDVDLVKIDEDSNTISIRY